MTSEILHTIIFDSSEILGKYVARIILESYQQKGKLVIGVPWGTTPVPFFEFFAELVRNENIDLSSMHFVVMDEYVVQTNSGYSYVNKDAMYSGHNHLEVDLMKKLPVKQSQQLQKNIHFPDPENPGDFDNFIENSLGGVDFFLVAAGAEDGHVAMCGPGTPLESRTRIVKIPESVREYNFIKMKKYFNDDKNNVPRYGISIGLRTILDARKLLFIANGSSKAHIVEILLKTPRFDLNCPVTFLWTVQKKTEVYLDKPAASSVEGMLKDIK